MKFIKNQIITFIIGMFFYAPVAMATDLKDMQGDEVAFEKLVDGKPTLIHFWATWCGSCMEELPSFIKFMNTHQSDVYNIIAISLDNRSIDDINSYIDQNYQGLHTYYDRSFNLMRSFEKSSIPYTAILDGDMVVFEITGPFEWQDKRTEHKLLSFLQKEKKND